MKGKVYLVGAGPGDPELLTLKALRLLRTAEAVLHDDLVAPSLFGVVERTVGRGKKRFALSSATARRPRHANAYRDCVRCRVRPAGQLRSER